MGMSKPQLQYNPWTRAVIMPDSKEMPLKDFQQLCFQNGWEGTLFNINAVAAAAEETIQAFFKKQWDEYFAEHKQEVIP
jgi:hypothetical protein